MAERTADLDRARAAVGRGAWPEAYAAYRALDPSSLAPEDLEGLADAAWWLSRIEESLAARQRAYAGHVAAGADPPAAAVALHLCTEHFLRGRPAVAAGWLMRAQRHLDGRPEGVEHGFLAQVEATVARFRGELDAAMGSRSAPPRSGGASATGTWSRWGSTPRGWCSSPPPGCPRAWRCWTRR